MLFSSASGRKKIVTCAFNNILRGNLIMLNIIGVPQHIDIRKEFKIITRFEFADCDLSSDDKWILRKRGVVIEGLMNGEIKSVSLNEKILKNYKRIWESYNHALKEEQRARREERLLTPSQREQYLQSRPLESHSSLSNTASQDIGTLPNGTQLWRVCPRCKAAGNDCPTCEAFGYIRYE